MIYIKINIGDLVTRNSYNNDIIFEVVKIIDNIVILKGKEVRLIADSPLDDLILFKDSINSDEFIKKAQEELIMDRNDYFYLPAKILHIDGDSEYLKRCLDFYKFSKILAIGKNISEDRIASNISKLLSEYKPDIVIITGHDAYYKKNEDNLESQSYKNTNHFVNAVKEARKVEKSHEKLVIIAGACQSNYEELIKAGANFASSPKRVNIHCLDPAIIATNLALTEHGKKIDLIKLLSKTKYGSDGMGGLVSNGMMYVGYPR